MVKGEPSGQAESLWGRIKASDMGQRVAREKPMGVLGALPVSFAGKKLGKVNVTHDELPGRYRPKTKETRTAWEYVLAFVERKVGEVTRDTLAAAAEECMMVMSTIGKDLDKKERVEKAFGGEISNEEYSQLANLCRKITDFDLTGGQTAGADDENKPIIEEETAMAVVFEEDDDVDEGGIEEPLIVKDGAEGEEGDLDASIPVPIIFKDESYLLSTEEEPIEDLVNPTMSMMEESDLDAIDLESLTFTQGK